MIYEIEPDDPRAAWKAYDKLRADIASLSNKDRLRVRGVFQKIEQQGLANLAEVDGVERRSFYHYATTASGARVYRCKVQVSNQIHFRFFFLERIRGAEVTTYYLLHVYKKKGDSDPRDVRELVRKRAEALTREW